MQAVHPSSTGTMAPVSDGACRGIGMRGWAVQSAAAVCEQVLHLLHVLHLTSCRVDSGMVLPEPNAAVVKYHQSQVMATKYPYEALFFVFVSCNIFVSCSVCICCRICLGYGCCILLLAILILAWFFPSQTLLLSAVIRGSQTPLLSTVIGGKLFSPIWWQK